VTGGGVASGEVPPGVGVPEATGAFDGDVGTDGAELFALGDEAAMSGAA
jgi:hypothetical protein